MVQESSYDQVVALVRLKENVIVFLYVDEDSLCSRSRSVLGLVRDRFSAVGYHVLAIKVDELSSHYEEIACVRVPQLRFFRKGRLRLKLTGLLTYEDLESALKTMAVQ
jgi:hypothetical protein